MIVITTISELISYRFGKLMFLIDVLSITPIEFISAMKGANLTEQMAYIECNHMLKVFRVRSHSHPRRQFRQLFAFPVLGVQQVGEHNAEFAWKGQSHRVLRHLPSLLWIFAGDYLL